MEKVIYAYFRVATGDEVMNLLNLFISTGGDPVEVSTKILEKLRQVRDIASKSLFFKTHTVST